MQQLSKTAFFKKIFLTSFRDFKCYESSQLIIEKNWPKQENLAFKVKLLSPIGTFFIRNHATSFYFSPF